ncbi:hypothetical protein KP79_PYT02207 [Mizuhopecten yessoensis]|uniref:Ig-like domain-containing protein n=2 Tax=Mizuhopecten yessoensis TaxID=6573 RepID=A0A210PY25_MIZYE|nr:hypothetical protein KP79_PYT02207 [Mizuhopecten yessoensis]
MAISHLEYSKAETEHVDLVAGDLLMITCDPKLRVEKLTGGVAHILMKQPGDVVVYRNIDAKAKDQYPGASYSMKLETKNGWAYFHYNITSLKVSDSGLWQCLTQTGPDNEKKYIRNMTLRVEPAADVGQVEFRLVKTSDGKEVKLIHEEGGTHSSTTGVTLLSGTYTMSCVAENGYPEPKYTIVLNGQVISQIEFATLNLTTADTNLACNVKVPRQEFSEHTLVFQLRVKEVEPEITCSTTGARVNDGRAVMNCTVVAADVTCKKVVWKSGTTNQNFEHGGTKVMGYDLSCMSNGVNSVWSSLEVKNLQQEHFDDTYFIKIKDTTAGDFQKEHQLKLLRKAGALNGSVQMTSLGSLALISVVTLLKMIL